MMRLILAASCAALLATQAQAISRYTSTSLTCDQVHERIARDGAALMRYQSARNPGLPRYGRYVYTRQFCQSDEIIETEYIRAKDTESCPVNGCRHYDPDDNDAFILR